MKIATIDFPAFAMLRCLMMPYIQGEPDSLPPGYEAYHDIVRRVFVRFGDIGYLTIDESIAQAGKPHRGARARHGRALHTEAGRIPGVCYQWGGGSWGGSSRVTLDRDTRVLIANNIDDTCAIWEVEHLDTTTDGDIGHLAEDYPYTAAAMMKAGDVHDIGILTPHESLPVPMNVHRQFLRIVGAGVHGREDYFTQNPAIRRPID